MHGPTVRRLEHGRGTTLPNHPRDRALVGGIGWSPSNDSSAIRVNALPVLRHCQSSAGCSGRRIRGIKMGIEGPRWPKNPHKQHCENIGSTQPVNTRRQTSIANTGHWVPRLPSGISTRQHTKSGKIVSLAGKRRLKCREHQSGSAKVSCLRMSSKVLHHDLFNLLITDVFLYTGDLRHPKYRFERPKCVDYASHISIAKAFGCSDTSGAKMKNIVARCEKTRLL